MAIDIYLRNPSWVHSESCRLDLFQCESTHWIQLMEKTHSTFPTCPPCRQDPAVCILPSSQIQSPGNAKMKAVNHQQYITIVPWAMLTPIEYICRKKYIYIYINQYWKLYHVVFLDLLMIWYPASHMTHILNSTDYPFTVPAFSGFNVIKQKTHNLNVPYAPLQTGSCGLGASIFSGSLFFTDSWECKKKWSRWGESPYMHTIYILTWNPF